MFIKRLIKSAGLLACGSGCWVAGGEDEGQGGGEGGQGLDRQDLGIALWARNCLEFDSRPGQLSCKA